MINLNKSGQALVETVLSLPVVVAGVTMILVGLHSLSFYYWFDHWTYEAAFCLVRETDPNECERELTARLNLMPFSSHQIHRFYRTNDHALVEVYGLGISTNLFTDERNISMQKIFSERISTKLSSMDFRGHQ